MSSISRRSLLGYTGTAAAGTILTTAGSAQAADTDAKQATVQAGASGVTFAGGTEFTATAQMAGSDGTWEEETISFRIRGVSDVSSAHEITPLDIANALSALAQSRGWPALTFYGSPAPAPLN
jgi:hypothetical protein